MKKIVAGGFLDKYNPNQFEILGLANSARYLGDYPCYTIIDGKKIYNRILIRSRTRRNGNNIRSMFSI